MFQLFKELVINNSVGWIEYDGEVISAEELSAKTKTLNADDAMAMAKKGVYGMRLLSLDEAAGRKYKEAARN